MTPDTTISITLLISVISIILAILNSARSARKDQQATIEAEEKRQQAENARQMDIEKNFVKINTKLDEFCSQSREMMAENAKKTDQLKSLSEKLIAVTEQVKQHESRIARLEEGK